MSKSRFEYINRCLTFAKPCETADERAARGDFWAVQPLVDAFNLCRRTVRESFFAKTNILANI
jgi:hypothetical protein